MCFSLLFAEQLLNGAAGAFGGAEVRGVTFLKGLAARDEFELHVVVRGTGASVRRTDGITMHFRPAASFFEGHHDSATRSIWADIDADVYVMFGTNEATSELARFCKAHGSALVVAIASDVAFDDCVREGSEALDRYGVPGHYIWYGTQHADHLIVQTERQGAQLRSHFGREATLIRNPAPAGYASAPRSTVRYGGRILWVGRVDPNKRPKEVFLLAAALPHRQFIVVCNNIRQGGPDTIDALQRRLPNVMIADQVDFRDVDALFHFSDVLLNTSVAEGFPNTFLQAGRHGIPVVSMSVDPDEMLRVGGAGRVGNGTGADLARQIEALLGSTTSYARASLACSRWTSERHDPNARIAEFAVLLHRVVAEHASRTATRVA